VCQSGHPVVYVFKHESASKQHQSFDPSAASYTSSYGTIESLVPVMWRSGGGVMLTVLASDGSAADVHSGLGLNSSASSAELQDLHRANLEAV
jgi:hypothetical protein